MTTLQDSLIAYTRSMVPSKWYSGKELDILWNVSPPKRKGIIVHLKNKKKITTRGNTSQIRYQVLTPPPEDTGNGVINAKLRREVNLPPVASSLENLISAATEVGTENEILRDKLARIRAILEEV